MSPRLGLLPMLWLAACASQEDRQATLTAALANGQASLAAAGAVVPIRPAPAAERPPDAPNITRVVDATGPQPGATSGLLGAPPEALRRWLGEPLLRRAEGPGEVWLYAGPACALDLVFYATAQGLRVAHAEARASGAAPRTEQACLQELATGGRPRGPIAPLAAAGHGAPAGG